MVTPRPDESWHCFGEILHSPTYFTDQIFEQITFFESITMEKRTIQMEQARIEDEKMLLYIYIYMSYFNVYCRLYGNFKV